MFISDILVRGSHTQKNSANHSHCLTEKNGKSCMDTCAGENIVDQKELKKKTNKNKERVRSVTDHSNNQKDVSRNIFS